MQFVSSKAGVEIRGRWVSSFDPGREVAQPFLHRTIMRRNHHQGRLSLHKVTHLFLSALSLLCVAVHQFAGHPKFRCTLLQYRQREAAGGPEHAKCAVSRKPGQRQAGQCGIDQGECQQLEPKRRFRGGSSGWGFGHPSILRALWASVFDLHQALGQLVHD